MANESGRLFVVNCLVVNCVLKLLKFNFLMCLCFGLIMMLFPVWKHLCCGAVDLFSCFQFGNN